MHQLWMEKGQDSENASKPHLNQGSPGDTEPHMKSEERQSEAITITPLQGFEFQDQPPFVHESNAESPILVQQENELGLTMFNKGQQFSDLNDVIIHTDTSSVVRSETDQKGNEPGLNVLNKKQQVTEQINDPMQVDPENPSGAAASPPPPADSSVGGPNGKKSLSLNVDQRGDIIDPLLYFQQQISSSVPQPLLNLPSAQQLINSTHEMEARGHSEMQTQVVRSSTRISGSIKKRKPSIKMAQEVLAKKWGVLDMEKDMEDLTLQQYINIYKKPFSQQSMAAVRELTQVAELKKKKKSSTKKNAAKAKGKAKSGTKRAASKEA
jgi:hypothetical protein